MKSVPPGRRRDSRGGRRLAARGGFACGSRPCGYRAGGTSTNPSRRRRRIERPLRGSTVANSVRTPVCVASHGSAGDRHSRIRSMAKAPIARPAEAASAVQSATASSRHRSRPPPRPSSRTGPPSASADGGRRRQSTSTATPTSWRPADMSN